MHKPLYDFGIKQDSVGKIDENEVEEEHEFVGKDTKKKSLASVFRSFGK